MLETMMNIHPIKLSSVDFIPTIKIDPENFAAM